MMRKVFTFLLWLLATTCFSQNKFGGYIHATAETFYTYNFSYSVGLRYKELKAGLFYQQAIIEHEDVRFTRKGIYTQIGIANVDRMAYFAIGARAFTSDDQFVSVIPHVEVSIRFLKRYEIPIFVSHYKSNATASIGFRVLL
jgi:hypothetical protein